MPPGKVCNDSGAHQIKHRPKPSQAPIISAQAINKPDVPVRASFRFNMVKIPDRLAEIKPTVIPAPNWGTTPKIIHNPKPIMSPTMGSIQPILVRKNRGSKKATNKVVALMLAKVTDTFEIFMAWKNVAQWAPTTKPVAMDKPNIFQKRAGITPFLNKKGARHRAANKTLHQTKVTPSRLIHLPNMPVKPKIKTVRCKSPWLFHPASGVHRI